MPFKRNRKSDSMYEGLEVIDLGDDLVFEDDDEEIIPDPNDPGLEDSLRQKFIEDTARAMEESFSLDDLEILTPQEVIDDTPGFDEEIVEARRRELEETRQGFGEIAIRGAGRATTGAVTSIAKFLQGLDRLPLSAAMSIAKRVDPEAYKQIQENPELADVLHRALAEVELAPDEEFQDAADKVIKHWEDVERAHLGRSEYSLANEDSVDAYLEQGTEVISQLGIALALNAAAPGANLGLGLIGVQEASDHWEESRQRLVERGYDPNEADLIAAGSGAVKGLISATIEKYAVFDEVMKIPKLQDGIIRAAAQKAGRLALGESAEEVATEFFGDTIRLLAEQDADAYEGFLERYGSAGFWGAVAGGGVSGPVVAAGEYTSQKQRAKEKYKMQFNEAVTDPVKRQKIFDLSKRDKVHRSDFEELGITKKMGKWERKESIRELADEARKIEQGEIPLAPEYAQSLEGLVSPEESLSPLQAVSPEALPAPTQEVPGELTVDQPVETGAIQAGQQELQGPAAVPVQVTSVRGAGITEPLPIGRVQPDAIQETETTYRVPEGDAEFATVGFKPNEAPPTTTFSQEEAAIHPTREAVSFGLTSAGERTDTAATVPREYVRDGKVKLFRYSQQDRGETYSIDPDRAIPGPQSAKDYQAAQTPRTFFYLNTAEKEPTTGDHLYSAEVDASDIYNLIEDPQGLKEKHPRGESYDFDAIFQDLQSQGKKGVYYNPGFHVVNLFEPVEGTRTTDSGRKAAADAGKIADAVETQIYSGEQAGLAYNPETGEIITEGFTVSNPRLTSSTTLKGIGRDQLPAEIAKHAGRMASQLGKSGEHVTIKIRGGKLILSVGTVGPTRESISEFATGEEGEALPIESLAEPESADPTPGASEARSILRDEYAWKTGSAEGKGVSKRKTLQRILDLVGITAGKTFRGMNPRTKGFYQWMNTNQIPAATTPAGGGRRMNIRKSEIDNIGLGVHEVAHFLDDKYNITGRAVGRGPSVFSDLTYSEELALRTEDYQQNLRRREEGWAEALRLYVMNETPGTGFRSMSSFSAFQKVLHDPRLREVRDMANQMRQYVEEYMRQPDALKVQQALSNGRGKVDTIHGTYFTKKERDNEWAAWMRSQEKNWINHMADMMETEKVTEDRFKELWESFDDSQTGGIDPEQAWVNFVRESGGKPTYLAMRHFNTVSTLADKAIREEMVDYQGKKYHDKASKIFEGWDQKKVNDFGLYMYSKVAEERYNESINPKTGIASYDPGEVGIDVLRQTIRDLETAEFQQAAKDVTSWFNGLLRMMRDHGLVDNESYDRILKKRELYMPFYRQFSDDKNPFGPKFEKDAPTPVKKLKGGSPLPVLDVYDAMVDRAHEVYGAINRKVIEETAIKYYENSGVAGHFLTSVKGPGEYTIAIQRPGKKKPDYYELDPAIYDVLRTTAQNPQLSELSSKLMSAYAGFTNIGRAMMVTYNPYYPLRALTLDMKAAAMRGLIDTAGFSDDADTGIFLREGGMVQQLWRNVKLSFGKMDESDGDKMYARAGGLFETRISTALSSQKDPVRRLKKGIERRQTFGKPNAIISKLASINKAMRTLNEIIELAPRKAAFFATLTELSKTTNEFTFTPDGKVTQGTVPQWAINQAMYNSQEITTNFNVKGRYSKYFESGSIFFSSTLAGGIRSPLVAVDKAMGVENGRLVIKDKKSFNRIVANMTLSALGVGVNYALMALSPHPEDEEKTMLDWYSEQPLYRRRMSNIFATNMFGQEFSISTPKDREFGFISDMAENLIWRPLYKQMGYEIDTIFDEGAEKGVQEVGAGIVEELSEKIPFTGGTVPVFAQWMSNREWFYNSEILTRQDRDKDPRFRYDDRSEWAQPISRYGLGYVGLSAKEIDFFARNMVGSMPANMIQFAQSLSDDNMVRWNKLPMAGPFITDPTPRQSEMDYYAARQKNTQRFLMMKEEGVEFSEEEEDEIRENEAVFGLTQQIKKIIRESEELNDYEKQAYDTGITRWALGRSEIKGWDNPMSNVGDLPNSMRAPIKKLIQSNLKLRKRKKGQPFDEYKAEREAARAKIKRIREARQ